MLNEGWDVKRVFQIVPHEERAFDSKLLIAQVLGRGLRIPDGWEGPQPEVTVFNHDAWAARIRHLVNEILEIERRLSCHIIEDSPYHFDLHNIDYTLEAVSVKKPMTTGYKLFEKGYVELPAEVASEDVSIEFERALTGERYKWQTKIHHQTHTPLAIAMHMFRRLEEEQDPDDPDPAMRTFYTDQFTVKKLEQIVKESLRRRGMKVATDNLRQKFLQALGPLRRKTSENVRYTLRPDCFKHLSTSRRQSDSVSAAELRRDKIVFFTDQTRTSLKDEQLEFFDEVAEEGSPFRRVPIRNRHDFKTPVNLAIADADPERRFINGLIDPTNVKHLDAWIKSTHIRFYEIDYAWKKINTPKRGKFSPDFFIKAKDLILAIEIKGNEELREPSEESRKKNEYAVTHFERVNEYLKKENSPIRYKFNFLTPNSFGTYFQYLREGRIHDYKSELDIKLLEDS
jgi:type III restriction enzyme